MAIENERMKEQSISIILLLLISIILVNMGNRLINYHCRQSHHPLPEETVRLINNSSTKEKRGRRRDAAASIKLLTKSRRKRSLKGTLVSRPPICPTEFAAAVVHWHCCKLKTAPTYIFRVVLNLSFFVAGRGRRIHFSSAWQAVSLKFPRDA